MQLYLQKVISKKITWKPNYDIDVLAITDNASLLSKIQTFALILQIIREYLWKNTAISNSQNKKKLS